MLEALILGEDPWWELIFHFRNRRCLCFQFVESNRRLLSFSLPLQFFFFSGLLVELGVQIRQGLLRYFFVSCHVPLRVWLGYAGSVKLLARRNLQS